MAKTSWVTHLSIILVGFALGLFLYHVISQRIEGFESNINAYKDSSDYKKQKEAIVDRFDAVSSKRRGINDMLSNGTRDMPEEYTFIHLVFRLKQMSLKHCSGAM